MNPQDEQPFEVEEKIYKNNQNSYEEISEKKTTRLGYILLFIMAFFIIMVGETVFSDLGKIPKKPIPPSYCILDSVENLKNLTRPSCSKYGGFNETDNKFGLNKEFNDIKPQLKKIISLNKDIELKRRDINKLQRTIQQLNKDYALSLQEKMAGENAITNKQKKKNQIIDLRNQINALRDETKSLKRQRDLVISQTGGSITALKKNYNKAQDYYQTKRAWYKFKVFLLTLTFVLPFFLFSLYYYLKLKKKNSPYTIILTATVAAFSILFIQIVSAFLYEIIPKEWFLLIFSFFRKLLFLRYVLYYGSVIFVIIFFGGVVYYIQKKVFSPTNVAIRRLKNKKCPGCSFVLNSHHNFCPNCGLRLKEQCKNCGNLKIRYLSHCPNCGK